MFGKVFSIEEFSIYDGPGIRTTVFFKGCPLRCEWCHSPEGQGFATEILRSPNGCLHCGACTRVGEAETGIPSLTESSIASCPRNLLRLSGTDYTPRELIGRLSKNLDVLNLNGGGVTFSGGEPTAQGEFLLACLQLLEGKTHRAIQTCGYCPNEQFAAILPHCDHVLYDLKLMDPALHLRYCGASNQLILENYRTLIASGIDFTTRIPLIPTVNDTEQNILETAVFLQACDVHYVEILPYHALTGSKYALVGRQYTPSFDTSKAPTPHVDLFNLYGIEVKVL